ncbi:hypothetical protein PACTADRAFT_49993 [Pachysolen tannophilus NRRL Y-2460]|uniref:Ribosome biogenesis protein YTM1 n=1 Tax=Pachysolen tannophilus NRRL Y-2460 TaxID=669874 RepID=A0A1E4TU47_PACTA|nr:hypothetical protein PACTADRAFT_49993 [Pachysolen tannophilus NRRL Y-2460]
MSEKSLDKSQIKIRFFTRDEDETLRVSENPLFVPVSLKRFGLSEVVNHLLGNDLKQIPFDFLIEGDLLKSSIEEYLTVKGLSSETFLSLEYTRSVLPPSFLGSFSNEDWVSSIDLLPTMETVNKISSAAKIVSGSYDGIVRLYNLSGHVEKQFVGHSGQIKAVKFISPTRILSAGNDRQIRLWKSKLSGNTHNHLQKENLNLELELEEEEDEENIEDGTTLAILEGHKAPVVSLDVNSKTNRILSASYDKAIGVWSTRHKEMTLVEAIQSNNLSTQSRKRQKLALKDSSIPRKSPLSFLEGHSSPVEGVIFNPNDSTVGYSCSQDHTIKTWDLVTSRCVDTRTTSYSLLSITCLSKLNLILCGSSARHITQHDPRINSNVSSNHQLVGHSNFVVSLDPSPNNDYMFSSASHDGTVKVWDVRANKAMYTIFRENDNIKETKRKNKVFAVRWDNEIGIVSGGDDKKIQINKGSDIAK